MASEPIAVVGDVHGDALALEKALVFLARFEGRVVFLGDYVNKGSNSKEVLDMLIAFQRETNGRTTFLLGNHEVALLSYLDGGDLDNLLAHAGLPTVRSYVGESPQLDPFAQFIEEFPTKHVNFLQSLETCFEQDGLLVAHAGFNPDKPLSRSVEDLVLGRCGRLFAPALQTPKPLVVCGHYVQRSGLPYLSRNLICLDTGCGSIAGAPLSVLLLPQREVRAFSGAE